jgi:hypothetical protein
MIVVVRRSLNMTCSYCLQDGYGTRLIPEGTITGAHFVKVVNDKVSYVQVTGQGDVSECLHISLRFPYDVLLDQSYVAQPPVRSGPP